jgi:hypothetical protein
MMKIMQIEKKSSKWLIIVDDDNVVVVENREMECKNKLMWYRKLDKQWISHALHTYLYTNICMLQE